MVSMVTGMCRSVPKKDLFYKLPYKVTILRNTETSFGTSKMKWHGRIGLIGP